ncbi:hypothetical protein IWZ03DRAFT_74107 [Phyllosticta citriasiana]|uniref:Secreted protein n=1 Tax=Phyllosticta citriasiana TaxID=595635 RepID=A0ABR1KD10_9PEZI
MVSLLASLSLDRRVFLCHHSASLASCLIPPPLPPLSSFTCMHASICLLACCLLSCSFSSGLSHKKVDVCADGQTDRWTPAAAAAATNHSSMGWQRQRRKKPWIGIRNQECLQRPFCNKKTASLFSFTFFLSCRFNTVFSSLLTRYPLDTYIHGLI